MKKLILNVKYFGIWGINKIYSLKDLRLDTPIPLPTVILILVIWLMLLTCLLIL
jgi:hypothetical protein